MKNIFFSVLVLGCGLFSSACGKKSEASAPDKNAVPLSATGTAVSAACTDSELARKIDFLSGQLSSQKSIPRWEYHVLRINASSPGENGQSKLDLTTSDHALDELGAQGWELVSASFEIATSHPNFGDPKFVTGVRSDVRTSSIVCILKRRLASEEK